jgi:hypothetical protein
MPLAVRQLWKICIASRPARWEVLAHRQANFLQIQQPCKGRSTELMFDGGIDDLFQGRLGDIADLHGLDIGEQFLRAPANQRTRDGVLAWKILIQRANAYPGAGGDLIGAVGIQPPRLQNASRRLQDCGDGRDGTLLARCFPGRLARMQAWSLRPFECEYAM